MNVKQKYMEDFTEELQDFNKQNMKFNRVGGREAQIRNGEMQKQLCLILQNSINKLRTIEEYQIC